MNYLSLKTIYFMGIKGVGMTPLAIIAKEAGYHVVGSDVADRYITDVSLEKANIEILKGFNKNNIDKILQENGDRNSLLVVTTAAHGGLQSVEAIHAKSKGISVITQGQALGLFMDGVILRKSNTQGISICGSHGKTTIAALLSTILMEAGMDPSYVVGTGQIFPVRQPGHFGKGEYFIAESDEYLSDVIEDRIPKFFYQHPKFIIVNNIDFDHPDMFSSLEEVKSAFKKFLVDSKEAILIINGDDKTLMEIIPADRSSIVTYGEGDTNMYRLTRFVESGQGVHFSAVCKGLQEYEFSLSLLGKHNALNALAAIAFCDQIGIEMKQIQQLLPRFKGSKRRLELLGKAESGLLVYDDYAHHPSEIHTTLKALKQRYEDKQVVCIFQPHTFSRTKSLVDEFASSFSDCDMLLLLPVFASAREKISQEDVSMLLFEAIKKKFSPVIFMKNHEFVVKYIKDLPQASNSIVVTMGAGDVYKIGNSLLK